MSENSAEITRSVFPGQGDNIFFCMLIWNKNKLLLYSMGGGIYRVGQGIRVHFFILKLIVPFIIKMKYLIRRKLSPMFFSSYQHVDMVKVK